MVGRSASPRSYFDYCGTLARELSSTGLAAKHKLDLSNESLISIPAGFLWENRNALSAELKEQIFRHSILADGQIETGCLLQDRKLTCENGHEHQHDLFFKWGSVTELPKYKVGDEIRWDGPISGIAGLGQVWIRATSNCPTCRQGIETLIPIINNRIQAEDNQLHRSTQYPFQAPFVSAQRIIWKQFQLQWHLEWVTRLEQERCEDDLTAFQRRLADASETEYSDEFVVNQWIRWLLSKYRRHLTSFEFETACRLVELQSIEPKSCHTSMDEKFHSPAVIKVKQRDHWRWGQFHWGSTIDFPEYEIGDSIRWKDCSFGSAAVQAVICNGSWLDSRERFELRIEGNRIVDCNSIRQDSLRYNAPAAYEPTTPSASWFLDDFEY